MYFPCSNSVDSDDSKENVFSNTDLPPIGGQNQIPVPVLDQQIEGSQSPKTLMDLDHIDQVFYDENMYIKKELHDQTDCLFVNSDMYSSYQMSQMQQQFNENSDFLENMCHNNHGNNGSHGNEQYLNNSYSSGNIELSCKEEPSQAIYSQLSALVQCHIKQEIDGICSKLRIHPGRLI